MADPFADFRRDRRYEVGRELARGGMGSVHEARQMATRRTVAVKLMLDDADESGTLRFVEEAQITAQLEHPNIVPVHDLDIDEEGRPFYTMKLVQGINLRRILQLIRAGTAETIAKYPLTQLLTIFQKICDGVAFAHARGVIHRDLKPENVMVGSFGEVLVMDWGLAKLVENDAEADDRLSSAREDEGALHQTCEGKVIGTPQYMSPEQASGQVGTLDQRSDVFALGAILYEIMLLESAFPGRTVAEVLTKIKTGTVSEPMDVALRKKGGLPHWPSSGFPESLAPVAAKALRRLPAERYQTVTELQAELTAYQNGFATAAEDPGLWRQFALLVRRHREKIFPAAAAILLLACATVVFVVRLNLERRRAVAGERQALESERRALLSESVAETAQRQAETEAALARTAQARAEKETARAESALQGEREARLAEKAASLAATEAEKDKAAAASRANDATAALEARKVAERAHRLKSELEAANVAIARGDFALALLHEVRALREGSTTPQNERLLRRRIALTLRTAPALRRVWDLGPANPPGPPRTVSLSPDGAYSLTEEAPGALALRETATGRRLGTVPGGGLSPDRIEWSPDGRGVAIPVGGQVLAFEVRNTQRSSTAWWPLRKTAAPLLGPLEYTPRATGVPGTLGKERYARFASSLDGAVVLGVGSQDSQRAAIFSAAGLQMGRRRDFPGPVAAAQYSSDARLLAIAAHPHLFLWDGTDLGGNGSPLGAPAGYIRKLAFGAPNRWLAAIGQPIDLGRTGANPTTESAVYADEVWLWRINGLLRDWKGPIPQMMPLHHTEAVQALAASGDGRFLLTATATLGRLWEIVPPDPPPFLPAALLLEPAKGWRASGLLAGPEGKCIAGRWVAVSGAEHLLAVWDADTERLLGPPIREAASPDFSWAFNPSQTIFFSASRGKVVARRLPLAETPRTIANPPGTGKAEWLLHPMGQRLAIVWKEGFLLLDDSNGEPVSPFVRFRVSGTALAYSALGQLIGTTPSGLRYEWDGLTGAVVRDNPIGGGQGNLFSTEVQALSPPPAVWFPAHKLPTRVEIEPVIATQVTRSVTETWQRQNNRSGDLIVEFSPWSLRFSDSLSAPPFVPAFPVEAIAQVAFANGDRTLYVISEAGVLLRFDLSLDDRPAEEIQAAVEELAGGALNENGFFQLLSRDAALDRSDKLLSPAAPARR